MEVTNIEKTTMSLKKFINKVSMVSDAIHATSDVMITLIVIIDIHMSSKEPAKEYPYGHERMVCLAAIVSIICKEAMYWYT